MVANRDEIFEIQNSESKKDCFPQNLNKRVFEIADHDWLLDIRNTEWQNQYGRVKF